MPDFSLYSILWFFFIYSFVGWCIEVVFCSVDTGHFVNRGFLNGPVCPIYGFGGVFIVLLLHPLEEHVLLLFLASVIVTSALELVTGFVLKKLFHTSWWDYSDQPFNIGGYICLKFSLAWGLAGVFLMKVLHPAVAGFVHLLPRWLGTVLLVVFALAFVADGIVTVMALMKLNRDLGEITRLAKGLHEGSEAIAKNLGDKAIEVSEKLDELDLKEKLEEGRENALLHLDAGKEKITLSLEEGRERLDALLAKNSFSRKRLLRAFPNMKSTRHMQALLRLREKHGLVRGQIKTQNKSDENAEKNNQK